MQVALEFNLIYRWHCAISEKDAKWTENFYSELFGGKPYTEVTMPEFMVGLGKWEKSIPGRAKKARAYLRLASITYTGDASRKQGTALTKPRKDGTYYLSFQ